MGTTLADEGIKRGGAIALTIVAALLFFGLALTHRFYAPGSGHAYHFVARAAHAVFGEDTPSRETAGPYVPIVLRKAYSIVAFGIVGFPLALAFRSRAARYRGAIIGVALFSAAIEVLQKVVDHSGESLPSNLFDTACGAVGGLIGAALVDAFRRRVRP